MNPLTIEWVNKAEADLLTARREFRTRKSPNYDAVCFHAQQAVEKFLKAILQEKSLPIPRSHSLIEILVLISKKDTNIILLQPEVNILEGYAVNFRYPGFTAEKVEAKQALYAAERISTILRSKLAE